MRLSNYILWQKEMVNWLSRTQKIGILRSPIYKEFSGPEETERDFRIRLQLIARERRDKHTEKLRQKYASKFARLDDRIRHAQQTKEEKYEVSAGATLLESMFGRKRAGGERRTSRDMSRKEEHEKKSLKEKLKIFQQEREDLEAQFQSEIEMQDTKTNPLTENLEKIFIMPSKADISIRLVALVWVPEWKDAEGKVLSAWK